MIREANVYDQDVLKEFFQLVLTDTYEKEGIGHLKEAIQEEVLNKLQLFDDHLNQKTLLMVMEVEGRIIGTTALTDCSELIKTLTPELGNLTELGAVFIHPDYQCKGYGMMLVDTTLNHLNNQEDCFCLDSGYTIAKRIWTKKFGEPYKIFNDYWGEGFDHYIWQVKNRETKIKI